ncbi:MAG: hypothetical protein ACJ796_12140 [Gemmatimonadaceae bacterium]
MRRRKATDAGSRRSIDRGVRRIGDDSSSVGNDGTGERDCEPGLGRPDVPADDTNCTVPSRGREGRASAARLHARVKQPRIGREEMSTIEMAMRSWARGVRNWACRVRNFVVERDVHSALAERTGFRYDHHDAVGQRTVDAAASEVITTQSSGQTTEVRRLRLGLAERQLEPTVCTTRAMKPVISGDDIGAALPTFGVNDKSFATTDCAMATVLTVLGLQFVVQGLASNSLELLRNATRVRRDLLSTPSM